MFHQMHKISEFMAVQFPDVISGPGLLIELSHKTHHSETLDHS